MSEKHRNAQKSMPQSRKLFKYQKRKIRRYLKRVRWRRKRRQRYFLYGLALAVSMYLASIWKMRERIWSIREMDVIEYELPEGERAENGAEEAPSDRQRREQLNGKCRGNIRSNRKTGTSTKIRLHRRPEAGNPARTGGIRKRVTVCGRKNVWPGMNDEWKSRNGYCGKFRHWPCMREQ